MGNSIVSIQKLCKLIAITLAVFITHSIYSYDPNYTLLKENKLPKELENIGIENTLGKSIPLNISFYDENENPITLQEIFSQGKPILLSPVYYKCPTLCNLHLNGVMDALRKLDWTVGDQFVYVAFSINPEEKPELAKEKKQNYLNLYNREGSEKGYYLLTGNENSIKLLTGALGFRYDYDPSSQQYIHASAAYVLTPQGKVARILQGITFQPFDLKLALVEAGEGKVGNYLDQFALYCFQFDPNKNKYTIYAYNLMRIGGVFTVLLLGAYLTMFWRAYKKNNNQGENA